MKSEEYIALGGLITICASALALVIKQVESLVMTASSSSFPGSPPRGQAPRQALSLT
jgi:hypothetical protein